MTDWLQQHRIALGVVVVVLVVLVGAGYVGWTAVQQRAAAAGAVAPTPGNLLFVDLGDGQDRVEQVPLAAPDGERTATALRCQRLYTAGGTTVCLRLAGPGPHYEAAVSDAGGRLLRTVALPGIPSRARVSPSGRVVSWTTFVSGDSYAIPGGFSTRTGVLDLRTGAVTESLEGFASTSTTGVSPSPATTAASTRPWPPVPEPGWFAVTWLPGPQPRLRPGAECPSLSPDGTKVAYKKRGGRDARGPPNPGTSLGAQCRIPHHARRSHRLLRG